MIYIGYYGCWPIVETNFEHFCAYKILVTMRYKCDIYIRCYALRIAWFGSIKVSFQQNSGKAVAN